MRCRKFYKRFLAGLCILAMLVSSLGPDIQAAAGSKGENRKQMERDMEELIKKTLKNEDPDIREDYPKGIFSFATLKGEVNEDNKDPLAVYLVRHGGTKGEQKVKIKFSDYSAEYGKDYYAKLDDSMFAEKVEANPDSVPLFYMFDNDPDADGGQTAIDEESVINAYGEERGKKIIALTKEYAESEAKAQEKAKTDAKASDEKKSASGQEKASSPLDQLIDETSQYTDSGYALTMDELLSDDERNENTATYGANMLDTIFPGAEAELVFAEGEYMKKIYVYPIDNETANGDRVFNIQINSSDKDLAWQEGENSSTVTILDDEKDETAWISIQNCPKSVGTDGKASVTLKRKGGLYKVSTVEFAVKAANKKVAKGTAIFMPDMKEKTVEFSVGDVNAKTVDDISFVLKKPVGAKIAGDKTESISLTDVKITERATTSGKDVPEDESPVGMNGTLAVNGIDLDLNNFRKDDIGGPCKDSSFTTSKSEMRPYIPDHSCACNGSWVAAALKKKINLEAVESVSIELFREDMEGLPCNNMFVAKVNKASGANYKKWNLSQDNVLAMGGDHQPQSTMTVNLTDGSVTNAKGLLSYKNDYMKYDEGRDSLYTDLSIAVKKTSGAYNGMDLKVYRVRLNFRNFNIKIQSADELEGHKGDKPGQLLFARTETSGQNTEEVAESTRYAYEKVNFKNYPDDYAYLDHLEFGDGTAIDPKYCEIGGTSVTLDMNDSFFNQYYKQIDAKNAKFDIKPVYAKKSVKLTINTGEHGGIEVEGVKYPRGTKGREITVHVGDKLKVKPYDIEPDYYFSSYEMIATGLNGKGDSKKIIYSAEEPDNMDILNYNYTIEPKYTFDGTSVIVQTENIPEGCGIEKTEWTYKKDKIHSGQILDIKATTAEDYRAKWTITSNTHEWHDKTFYGDTLYHKVGGPTDEIKLEFEKCSNMQYVSVSGKTLVQDATIKNKPFLNSKGVYLGNYVPVANASVQMGEFSGLTKQDGNYTIYSHTESQDTAGGQKTAGVQKTLAKNKMADQKMKVADPHVDHSKAQPVKQAKEQTLGEKGKTSAYYLSEDINGKITTYGDVTLCLNGHKISASSSVIEVRNGVFRLCDCKGTGVVQASPSYNTAVTACERDKGETVDINIHGGTINGKLGCGRETNIYGGQLKRVEASIYEQNPHTLNIYDGIITDEIEFGGDFNIYGGEIKEGFYIFYGDNVEFNMSGGTVSSGDTRAAIDIYGDNTIVNITGGTVTGEKYNEAIHISGDNCSVNITGGTLESKQDYGIWLDGDHNTFNMSGGTVTGGNLEDAINVSGSTIETFGIDRAAKITISGGTVTAQDGYGLYCSLPDSVIDVSGGTVTGDDAGVEVWSYAENTVMNMTGGTIEGKDKEGISFAAPSGILKLMGGSVIGGRRAVDLVDGADIQISGDYTYLSGKEADIDLYYDNQIFIAGELKRGENPYRVKPYSKVADDFPVIVGWDTYMAGVGVSDYFVLTDSAKVFTHSGSDLVIKNKDEVNPLPAPELSAPVDPTGANVTTYLKAGPNETRTVKVIHNGLEQVKYIKITGDLNGVHSSPSDPYVTTDIPALELDFFGEGPVPSDINTLLGTPDEDDFPTRLETSEKIEMRNYSVGFELTLADVLDAKGEDLIDKVNFYIYNKDNVLKTTHTVEREKPGQTVYTLDRYLIQDDEGNVGNMKLNGLIDFADGDKIYVELVGTMKDQDGNKVEDADMSYGMYDSGIRFQEKLDIVEVQLRDVEPGTEDGGVPTVDILGQMIPTVKIGRLGVSAVVTSNTMEFSVGFDLGKLNKGIYDSWAAENTQKANALQTDIDNEKAAKADKQKSLDDKQAEYKTKEEEYQEIWSNPDPSDADKQRAEQLDKDMTALEKDMNTLSGEIDTCNKTINEKQTEYDKLTAPPEKQADPLDPALPAEGDDNLDVTKPVTPDQITNPTEVTGMELNPLDKGGSQNPWTQMKEALKKAAKNSGMTKPKSEGVQGHGTISASLGVDIGVTVRLKTQVMKSGNAEWCFDKALVYLKVSGGISAMYYFIIPNFPIPMYAGASFSASVGMYQGMGSQQKVTMNEMGEEDFDGSELYYSGDIPVTLGIEGFVGMGLKSLLAVELGIGFLQKFDFAFTADGGQIGTGMSSFYGYVQTNVLFFSFKWKFAQANWSYELYNTTKDAKTNLQKLMRDNGLGSDAALSEFTVEDTPKVHYYGEAKAKKSFKRLRSSYAKNDSTVLAEGLTRTVSDIVPLGGGTYLMAFEGARAEADCPSDMKPGSADYDCNSRAIYLSYFDGSEWSAPVILQKDDTLDTGLQIEEIGDDILISWSSADRRFTGDDIYTGKLSEDGEKEIREDAAVKVLSSLDVYAAVLKKSGVESFVKASAEDKEAEIDRLTKDQDLTGEQRKNVEENLAEGAEYLGYGHENGQAVSVGDQIYLFYDTIDYNYWKDGKKPENLSDIVDAKGYILYKIYDKKTGKWMEGYADSADKDVYEKLGFTLGQRMADIHLSVSGSDEKILPMVSQMDAQAVKVKGEDRIALTYMVDSNGVSGMKEDGSPEGDQALFIAFMTPAEIADGTVKAEAAWSEPLQMSEELSSINAPQMVQTKNNGKETVYLVWADDDCLMYTNLNRLFQKVEAEEADGTYTPVEVSTAELENGKKVEVYTMKDGVEASIAILGDEENGFQYNNGYRLAADDKGHIYAVWAQSTGSAQGIYISAMSVTDENGAEIWSKPRALDWNDEDGGKYLTDPSIAVDSDGTIILGHNAYNLENVTTKDTNGNQILDSRKHADDTFCVTVEKAVGSPVLEDAELSNDYPRAGEPFTVTATTGNDGFLAAEQIHVKAEFIQKKGGTEKVLDTQTQTFTNVGSGHRDAVNLAFTMKQEYLDAAKNDQASYQIRLTASEKKAGEESDYAETATASVDVKTGAHYVFTNENVDGYRCRDIKRDTEAGTIEFGKETGENRYMYSATVMNDGNLPAEDMKVAMFVSNENAFTSTRDKNGTYEGTAKELTEYYKTHSATESVANNENFKNWIAMKSFVAEDVKSLGVGESADLDVVTTKIADDMYSNLGAMDLMLAVYDKAAAENAATKSEGISTQPVSIVEEENVRLTLCSGYKKAGDQTVTNGSTTSFNALVLPLKAAPDYNVLWESSNPKVATVNNGDVTAVGAGTATIKASLMKDGKEVMNRSVDVTVKGGDNPSASQPPAATQKPQDNSSKQVKLSFDGNKGKVQGSAAKTVTVGEKYGKLPKAARKGYTFKGWYTAKSGGTKVTKDTKVTNASAHSLYARWKKVTVGRVQVRKLTAQKGKLKISLKPVKSADGYQICYAPEKKFKKNKKKLNTKKKTVTLKKRKKGKTWYVKARAYKLDSAGKKVFGKYSRKKKKKL